MNEFPGYIGLSGVFDANISIVYKVYMYDNFGSATYLLDYEDEKVTHLANLKENVKIDELDISDELKEAWKSPKKNTLELKHNIKEKTNEDDIKSYILFENNKEVREIKSLKPIGFSGTYTFVDETRIGALLPASESNREIGYHKFVIIDVMKDEIIQECPINVLK